MHQKMKPKQQGFRSGRSCFSHHDMILVELEKSNNVDVIFLDFAKLFDIVNHGNIVSEAQDIVSEAQDRSGIKGTPLLSEGPFCPRVYIKAPPIDNTYIWYKLRNSGHNMYDAVPMVHESF